MDVASAADAAEGATGGRGGGGRGRVGGGLGVRLTGNTGDVTSAASTRADEGGSGGGGFSNNIVGHFGCGCSYEGAGLAVRKGRNGGNWYPVGFGNISYSRNGNSLVVREESRTIVIAASREKEVTQLTSKAFPICG